MNCINRYKDQNTKGIKGIIKIVREDITIVKWKLQSLYLRIKIRIKNLKK